MHCTDNRYVFPLLRVLTKLLLIVFTFFICELSFVSRCSADGWAISYEVHQTGYSYVSIPSLFIENYQPVDTDFTTADLWANPYNLTSFPAATSSNEPLGAVAGGGPSGGTTVVDVVNYTYHAVITWQGTSQPPNIVQLWEVYQEQSGESTSAALLSDIATAFPGVPMNPANAVTLVKVIANPDHSSTISLPERTFGASESGNGGDLYSWHLLRYRVIPYQFAGGNWNATAPHSPILSHHGDNSESVPDPSFTRWLPLSFTPTLNSQPVRYAPGPLSAPWGNVNCPYSISLHADAHPDLPWHSIAFDTNGNVIPPSDFAPAYAIIDADGHRLRFNSSLTSYSDVHSVLAKQADGTYVLSHAGPPGALEERGYYSYTFEATPESRSLSARLISIQDDAGNQQTLNWNSSGPTFLTVLDSSSGRSLTFATPGVPTSHSYLATVTAYDATLPVAGAVTQTQFDSGGHLINISTYAGDGTGPYRTQAFTYPAAFPHAFTGTSRNLGTVTYGYADNAGTQDGWYMAIPKFTTSAAGLDTDTSSSDGSTASVKRTVLMELGEEDVSASGMAAHTDHVTDSRGNQFVFQYSYGTAIDDTPVGVVRSTFVRGPDYGGAPANTNWLLTQYSPNINCPAQITMQTHMGNWLSYFDSNGNLISAQDPLGNGGTFSYSSDGTQLTSATDATGLTSTFHYGEGGAPASCLTSVVDPAGHTTGILAYNSYGQTIQTTSPAAVSATGTDETTHFDYDVTTGDLTKVTSPVGDVTTISAHDALGDPTSFLNYPDTGNPATSTVQLAGAIVWSPTQQPLSETYPNGVHVVNTYNNGVLTGSQKLGPDGTAIAQTTYSFDSRGRVYAITDQTGIAEQYRFDSESNPKQVWDANGSITHFAYGANDEVTGVTWPDGAGNHIYYDAIGRHHHVVDERGLTTDTRCDVADRLTQVFSPDDANAAWDFTYDAAGRILTAVNLIQSLTYHYDHPNKWLTAIDHAIGGYTFTVSYAYYGDGKRQSMTSPAGTTTYSYDADGRLATLTNPYGEVTTWSYDHAGRLIDESTTSGTATLDTANTWGVSGQASDPSTAPAYLRTITQQVNGQPFRTYTLTHSYSGQLLEQDGSGQNGMFGETRTFAYDARGRVTADNESFSSPASETNWNSAFTYDAAGNVQANNPDAGESAWTYNGSNQVTSASYWGGAFGLFGAADLAYDAAGNVTHLNNRTLHWNVYGQLAEVTSDDGWTDETYTYDCLGRRVARSNAWATTYFVYDGQTLIAEIDAWSGSPISTYTWGSTGLISTHDCWSGVSNFHAYDATGNTRAEISSVDGTVSGELLNTAYGDQMVNSAPYGMRFGWQGRFGAYNDAETGLVYMGSRYYFPDLGRFVSRDAYGFAGGMNLYAFCSGDPIDFTDPNGTWGISQTDLTTIGDYARGVGEGFVNGAYDILADMYPPAWLMRAQGILPPPPYAVDSSNLSEKYGAQVGGDLALAASFITPGGQKAAVEKGVVEAYGMATLDMDRINTAGMRAALPGLTGRTRGYVQYVVRDVETGEILKYGQTNNYAGRFGGYATRARSEGRQIAIDIFEVDKKTARSRNPKLESEIQENLFNQQKNLFIPNDALPWDKSTILKDLRAGNK